METAIMGKLMNACTRDPALAGMGYARETVAMDVRKLALAEALLSTQGSRGQRMGKEAAAVPPLLVCHSTMDLHCYCGLGFLQKHSSLQIFPLPSPQAVSLQPTVVFSPYLPSKSHIPAPNPH